MTTTPARWVWLAATLVLAAVLAVHLVPPRAAAEQASSAARPAQAGFLDAGAEHTCAVLADHTLRCWGKGLAGRLGYGSDANVLSAAAAPPVNLGGHGVRAIAAGDFHTCAILDDGTVRCWGFGANGRLGYGNTANVLDPATAPPVDLGPGRTAIAITAGASHTCAILDDHSVRCWGNGVAGRLGYGNQDSVGDDETPAAAGPVDLGPARTARAIAAGSFHTCAILDDGSLRCWGFGSSGQLGYGTTANVGDTETPAQAGPVPLPSGRSVRAIAGGTGHTCAILDDGTVRCWGFGADGRLGYGDTNNVSTVPGPVSIGPGRTATAIALGDAHTCAILDDGTVRCWGFGGNGRLGYADSSTIGATPSTLPSSAGPVDLGPGRTARAITLGFSHTCAELDDGTLRCWGFGGSGRLGYGDETSVAGAGNPSIASMGPVPLPAPLATTIADLTLAISSSATRVELGATVTLTVAVANGGPDPTTGVWVGLPAPAGLTYTSAAASPGAFNGATGRWDIGVLPAGATAVLQATARAVAPGDHAVAAQIGGTSAFDPRSGPAGGGGGNDRGVVVISVAAPPDGPPGPRITSRPAKLRPRGLAMTVTRRPRRGVAIRLKVSGRLVLPRARPPVACGGRVLVTALAGRRVVTRRVALRRRAGACRYSTTFRPPRARARRVARVSARFLGTGRLQVMRGPTRAVRIR